MKSMIVRGAAIALFAALMTVGGPAAAARPSYACTAELEGTWTTTPWSGGYDVWECMSGTWWHVDRYVCDQNGCYPL